MIISAWNIRGLNKPYKQKELRLFLQKNKVDILGRLETRVKKNKANNIVNKVAKDWGYCCNYTKAINGRIWLLWKTILIVKIVHIHEQFIHCSVEDPVTSSQIMLTVVYARNKVQERVILWHDLQLVEGQIQVPWLRSGDFNNVLTTDDRLGQPVTASEVQDFKQCIDNMQLAPLRTKGCFYTWCNKQNANDRVYSKIYWAFGNFSWTKNYGHLEADFLEHGVSDHSPIIVQIWKRRTIHPKPFKLYMVTMEHKDFRAMVDRVWQQQDEQDPMTTIWQKLHKLKDEAKGLNKEMESYEQRLTQIRQRLGCTQANLTLDPFNQMLIEQEKQTMNELEKWSTIEERILRQKSRVTWIDYGDSNSKYFYA
ncbi:PREDICTED: uncharacterized protein LOC109220492 [Nicotiana attenuata]|uniref:uncharacterized protein LOC109220492 n=1 Tax=Nicotiana attenuata TaxID=49451 RepID=UPI000904EC4C|nr:PREDICTED: uncharacterized protein LOC109220492 [Nicotiana attenuata]